MRTDLVYGESHDDEEVVAAPTRNRYHRQCSTQVRGWEIVRDLYRGNEGFLAGEWASSDVAYGSDQRQIIDHNPKHLRYGYMQQITMRRFVQTVSSSVTSISVKFITQPEKILLWRSCGCGGVRCIRTMGHRTLILTRRRTSTRTRGPRLRNETRQRGRCRCWLLWRSHKTGPSRHTLLRKWQWRWQGLMLVLSSTRAQMRRPLPLSTLPPRFLRVAGRVVFTRRRLCPLRCVHFDQLGWTGWWWRIMIQAARFGRRRRRRVRPVERFWCLALRLGTIRPFVLALAFWYGYWHRHGRLTECQGRFRAQTGIVRGFFANVVRGGFAADAVDAAATAGDASPARERFAFSFSFPFSFAFGLLDSGGGRDPELWTPG